MWTMTQKIFACCIWMRLLTVIVNFSGGKFQCRSFSLWYKMNFISSGCCNNFNQINFHYSHVIQGNNKRIHLQHLSNKYIRDRYHSQVYVKKNAKNKRWWWKKKYLKYAIKPLQPLGCSSGTVIGTKLNATMLHLIKLPQDRAMLKQEKWDKRIFLSHFGS